MWWLGQIYFLKSIEAQQPALRTSKELCFTRTLPRVMGTRHAEQLTVAKVKVFLAKVLLLATATIKKERTAPSVLSFEFPAPTNNLIREFPGRSTGILLPAENLDDLLRYHTIEAP